MNHPIADITPEQLAENCAFVAEAWRRFPDAPPPGEPVAPPDREALAADPAAALRRYRQLATIHILWRDLTGADDLPATGRALSRLARECLERAVAVAESRVAERHGRLSDDRGAPCGLVVFGLGKLGGDELNLNSDIDLVFAGRGTGSSDGQRPLEAVRWYRRAAREVIELLDRVTPHGRVWIVDTRLRPFGEAGALVWSTGAMEQYFLGEGRVWERYAWLKADAVAGDIRGGRAFLENLRPFIYRRYLDYGIFDSLRELHRRIDADGRREHDDIKRGAGGIRELEFLVQSLQILRGGRQRQLRQSGFLPALAACTGAGLLDAGDSAVLKSAYVELRIIENRLQAMTGRQTHRLPDDPDGQQRLARLMGAPDWDRLAGRIDTHRRKVAEQFRRRLGPPRTEVADTPAEHALWPPPAHAEAVLAEAGLSDPAAAAGALAGLHRGLSRRPISAEGRRRLDRLMPRLLDCILDSDRPDPGFGDLLALIEQIARRSAYLALLHERPETLERLVAVFRASARISRWIIDSPQLLDDLIDPVHGRNLPTAPEVNPGDPETSLWALDRWRQAGFLRTALAELDGIIDAVEAGTQLAAIAETLLDRALALAEGDHRQPAIIAYGNLGAGQLHFDSDLDLVFLHAADEPPLRVVQRLISTMHTPLPGGRLFEIDTRLRPNGRAGLLVSRHESFDDYQKNRAWTWEHQALIRARWVAGASELRERFETTRRDVLTRPRRPDSVAAELGRMRRRQRRERDESRLRRLLTDIQFIAEHDLLIHAARHPDLIERRTPGDLLAALARAGCLPETEAEALERTWRELLARRHLDWLQREPAALDTEAHEAIVAEAWARRFPDRS